MENVSSRCGKSDNAPRLRFPEFRGKWIEKKLGEIFKKNTEKNTELKITNVICNSAKNGLIPQREYFDKDIANSENINGYYIIQKYDFVYNPRKSTEAPYGPVSVYKYPDKGIVSPLYLCFRATEEINSDFYEFYFKSYSWHRYIYLSGDNGARHDRVSMRDDVFFAMPVNIPSLPEQKKIAAFFTLLDRRIQKQRQLVECLKTYKRGVSEAIFERRLNFSSLLATEWKKYKLGQIGEFYNGLSGKSREDFGNGNCKFITYMNVYKNIIADESLCESVKIRKEEEQNSVKYGDVLFTQSSETLEEVGYTSVWTHSSQPYLNSFCFGYRFYDSVMTNPIFIAHYMRSNYIRKAIMKEGQGATRVNLSAERLKNLNIFLPDIKGQNKIAEFLSGLEDRIHKEESVLENMTMEKSSLLQKMFF